MMNCGCDRLREALRPDRPGGTGSHALNLRSRTVSDTGAVARFERLVGLRGRKMYEAQVPGAALVDAVVDLVAGTYSTCTPVRSGDDPEQLGLNLGSLPGGRFLRGHLQGEPPPPEICRSIGPGFR